MELAIQIDSLSKQYRLGLVSTHTLKHDLNRWWQTSILKKEDPYLKVGESNDRTIKGNSQYVWALKDINLEVNKGDVLGIIGMNGAGKSTLLKILSKVTTPSTGSIKAKGRIASLLEVGTGFHAEMTGKENIYLNGAIMGMNKTEISRKLDHIIEFSGVERYIDTPVKRYSSGMIVRLGFAIAAHLEPEILVVDEVLAVGDAEFQQKAIGKMQDVSRGEGRTVLFVSHNMGAVSRLCNKGLLLENGQISFHGNTADTIARYLSAKKGDSPYIPNPRESDKKDAYFKKIATCGETGEIKADFFYDEAIYVHFQIGERKPINSSTVFCMILDKNLNRVFASESRELKSELVMKIEPNFLVRGEYSIHAFIHIPRVRQIDIAENICHFSVIDNGSSLSIHGSYDYGNVFGKTEWS